MTAHCSDSPVFRNPNSQKRTTQCPFDWLKYVAWLEFVLDGWLDGLGRKKNVRVNQRHSRGLGLGFLWNMGERKITLGITFMTSLLCVHLHSDLLYHYSHICQMEQMPFCSLRLFFFPHYSWFLTPSSVFLQTVSHVSYIHMQLFCSSDLHSMAAFTVSSKQ